MKPEKRAKFDAMAREMVQGSIIEDAVTRFVSQIIAECASAAVARADALEAERDALRDALRSIEGMVANATSAPMTADRWLDRIEERARAALGGQP